MEFVELVHRFAVLVMGEDTPELRADLAEYIVANPPPLPSSVDLTHEEFDAAVAACGGTDVVRRSAMEFYGIEIE